MGKGKGERELISAFTGVDQWVSKAIAIYNLVESLGFLDIILTIFENTVILSSSQFFVTEHQ